MDLGTLEKAYRQEKDAKVRGRLLMVMGILDGKTTRKVAADLHCPQPNVVYWKKRFEKGGVKGLRDRPRSGRPPKVARWRLECTRRLVKRKQCWTATEVMKLIHERTGAQYSLMHVTRLLHKWGLSKQRPRRRHIKAASHEEVARFKKRLEEQSKKPQRRAAR